MPDASPRRLGDRQRERLLRDYAQHRRPADLESLVISYASLARPLARRYRRGTHLDMDIEQAACEGLVKAIKRYDPSRGSFTNYAVPTILGEVRRFLRDNTWAAHVPRRVQERAQELRALGDAFAATHSRAPAVDELSTASGHDRETVVEALTAVAASSTLPIDDRRDAPDGLTLGERLGGVDPRYERIDHLMTLEQAFPSLPDDERAVIALRYAGDLTQGQIAAELGLSRSHVGRLIKSGIHHLRAAAA